MERLESILDGLSKYIIWFSVITLLVMVVMVNASVLLRYVFSISFQWMEELVRYMHIGIVILLCGPLIWSKSHITMDLIVQKTKGKTKKIVRIIGEICTLILVSFTFVHACSWVEQLLEYRITTFSTVFEQWQPSMIIPLGFGIATLFITALIIHEIVHFNTEDEEEIDLVMEEVKVALEAEAEVQR